ncbi:MBL fold metallo-hydrolase [Mesorhizobium sp. INR15]|uniref:MBL fold metallo-hydrolase n=1 Tax=Mesorhizobium sp. INR15 TaxID=2654248 RepID=UPI0018964ED6|nr:MBL fold metallo-hydrolase [Mesorhizobium sp. INR15]QPC95265.1 MBL fold metallo-hydrolase [Mesorhizobium sp. INR15]
MTITLIGGPTALIEIAGIRFLTDPTFDVPQAYEAGAVRLVKQSGPAIGADDLPPIDVVLLSHDQHLDNLDLSGRAFLPRAGRVLTTEVGASRLGGSAEGLAPWQGVDVAGHGGRRLRITATPARHGPHGIEPISGDVVGFVISLDGDDGPSVYVSGDTVWFDGVAEVARRFDIKVAILFTGSARPRGAFHMTMDSNDAIEAANAFPQARIVAIHNEGWQHFTETQTELALSFKALGIAERLTLLDRGVAVDLAL